MDVETPEMWGMGVRIKGHSPLTIAATNGDSVMARLLLDWGADVNRQDGHGDYPLFDAAWSGDLATVQLLLQAGARPDAIGSSGSALHIAAAMGHLDVMNLLLAQGVPINLVDRDGNTPLDSARMSGNNAAMEFLLERGAESRGTEEVGSREVCGIRSNASLGPRLCIAPSRCARTVIRG
jgi:ankyrin repeat protein